jgi:hypothetical protein
MHDDLHATAPWMKITPSPARGGGCAGRDGGESGVGGSALGLHYSSGLGACGLRATMRGWEEDLVVAGGHELDEDGERGTHHVEHGRWLASATT